MAQKPDGKAAKTERVTFTRPAAERIAKAVRKVEQGDRDCAPLRFDRVSSSQPSPPLKLATFTGNWQTGTYKTVTLHGSTATASVYNWCNPSVHSGCSGSSRYVIFAKVNGTQSAVELPLSQEVFRVCTYDGGWSIGSSKTVTFKNQTCTPNTASATNLFLPLPDLGSRDCAIAKDGSAWYLIQAQFDTAQFVTDVSLTTSAIEFTRYEGVSLGTAATVAISITTCATAAT